MSKKETDNDEQSTGQDAISEWMKIMLGEIERKRSEDEEAEEELARRRGESKQPGRRAAEADDPAERR